MSTGTGTSFSALVDHGALAFEISGMLLANLSAGQLIDQWVYTHTTA